MMDDDFITQSVMKTLKMSILIGWRFQRLDPLRMVIFN